MKKEKTEMDKKKFDFNGLLLLAGLTLLLCVFNCKNNSTSGDEENTEELKNKDQLQPDLKETIEITDKPQYSEQTPKPKPADPFAVNGDFEIMRSSSDNKADFDFTVENQKVIPTFNRKNGEIDFELIGAVRTAVALEKKVPLSLEIYDNDQISFFRREKTYAFDLPIVKETERKVAKDKARYGFNFKKTMELNPGLYYFLIAPTGRNRVLFVGKFNVK